MSYFPNTECLEENILKSTEDIYYNKDKFDSGEINLCFITGHSGSGKSTMGRNMAGNKIEHYELDDVVTNKLGFTMDNLKEYGDLIYSFFRGSGRRYYYTKEDVDSGKVKGVEDYEENLIKDFINYSIKYARSHKDTKYVIEGIWILDFVEPSKLKDYAVYIKGTSLLVSTIRAANRDSAWEKNQGNSRIKAWIGRVKEIKNFASCEKDLRRYINYFSKLSVNENVVSNQDDRVDYGLPKLKKYPMPDEKHVLSAIRFFNYVSPENEKELARNIKKKMKQYNITPDRVGDKNRLKKYLKEDSDIITEFSFDTFDSIKPVLVFDIGSVLVEYHKSMEQAIKDCRVIPDSVSLEVHNHIINTFNSDKVWFDCASTEDYYKRMMDEAPTHIKKYIPAALKADIDNSYVLPYTHNLLKDLSNAGYELYYISNWSRWTRDALVKNGTFSFLKYFKGGIFSCDVGLMKPDKAIFEEFSSRYHIDLKCSMLFDDNSNNIQTAINCGMTGVLFNREYTPQWIYDNFLVK